MYSADIISRQSFYIIGLGLKWYFIKHWQIIRNAVECGISSGYSLFSKTDFLQRQKYIMIWKLLNVTPEYIRWTISNLLKQTCRINWSERCEQKFATDDIFKFCSALGIWTRCDISCEWSSSRWFTGDVRHHLTLKVWYHKIQYVICCSRDCGCKCY